MAIPSHSIRTRKFLRKLAKPLPGRSNRRAIIRWESRGQAGPPWPQHANMRWTASAATRLPASGSRSPTLDLPASEMATRTLPQRLAWWIEVAASAGLGARGRAGCWWQRPRGRCGRARPRQRYCSASEEAPLLVLGYSPSSSCAPRLTTPLVRKAPRKGLRIVHYCAVRPSQLPSSGAKDTAAPPPDVARY